MAEKSRFALEAEQALAGFPERSSRLWRRSDPRDFAPPGVGGDASGAPLVSPHETIEGLSIQTIPAAASEPLGSLVPPAHGWFEAFQAVHGPPGLLVRVAAGARIEAPLRIIYPGSACTSLPRLLVVLEQGASLTLVEEHRGGGAEGRVVGVAESLIGPEARLVHLCSTRLDPKGSAHLTRRVRLAAGAEFEALLVFLGGRAVKVDHGALLAGEGATARLYSLAFGQGREHLDLYTLHHHQAPRTFSDMSVRAALAGSARSIYTGLIRIDESCPGSQAYQENRNLLLSPRARADALPELEILTDDVVCTHGATLAPVDPEQLFYLRARGLSHGEALRLVLLGFFEPCLGKLPASERASFEQEIEQRVARIGASA